MFDVIIVSVCWGGGSYKIGHLLILQFEDYFPDGPQSLPYNSFKKLFIVNDQENCFPHDLIVYTFDAKECMVYIQINQKLIHCLPKFKIKLYVVNI